MNVLWVALGSAAGGVCRYLVSIALNGTFPLRTMVVNIVGSLIIGALSGMLTKLTGGADAMRAFAIVGFCGGFTTFSTFSSDAFKMIECSQWSWLVIYVFASVMAGICAVWIGQTIIAR